MNGMNCYACKCVIFDLDGTLTDSGGGIMNGVRYAVEQLGKLPYKLKQSLFPDPMSRGDAAYWCVKLQQGDKVLVDPGDLTGYATSATFRLQPLYPIAADKSQDDLIPETTSPTVQPTAPMGTEPETQSSRGTRKPENIPDGYLYRETENYWDNGGITSCELYYYEAPEYTVTVYMEEGILDSSAMHLLTLLIPRTICNWNP